MVLIKERPTDRMRSKGLSMDAAVVRAAIISETVVFCTLVLLGGGLFALIATTEVGWYYPTVFYGVVVYIAWQRYFGISVRAAESSQPTQEQEEKADQNPQPSWDQPLTEREAALLTRVKRDLKLDDWARLTVESPSSTLFEPGHLREIKEMLQRWQEVPPTEGFAKSFSEDLKDVVEEERQQERERGQKD